MVKVITYGTFDVLHYGHIRLLERVRELGDYMIVGVTSDDYDKTRGKINNQQSLMERIAAVEATGIADMVIVEEYEGQKIADIQKYHVDIFTVGSDWTGYFDYLKEYCKVIYLPRTAGISSSEIRRSQRSLSLGMTGESSFLNKVATECKVVNGINLRGVCAQDTELLSCEINELPLVTRDFDELLAHVDAVYIRSQPAVHYEQIKAALKAGKHVLCEAPRTLSVNQWDELTALAEESNVVLMDAIKTAYATAYERLLLLLRAGKIGDIVSVDATCTSMAHSPGSGENQKEYEWDNIYEWGPTALLPVLQILGIGYREVRMAVRHTDKEKKHDSFTKMEFVYPKADASIQTGNGVKSEGELVVSGTKGYLYVPAPWWKTDYFETRYENPEMNRRYFYQLEGEGIRYELVAFAKAAFSGERFYNIAPETSRAISRLMEKFVCRMDVVDI